jgi:hypothetical protein
VKLLGQRIRKEGACRRGHDIRAATFVSRLSELERKDRILQWIEEVLEGQTARRPRPAKTARERRPGKGNCWEGNSPAWRKGGAIGN